MVILVVRDLRMVCSFGLVMFLRFWFMFIGMILIDGGVVWGWGLVILFWWIVMWVMVV